MADKFLTVEFCCNDGRNGAFRGVFDSIEVSNSRGDELRGDCFGLEDDQAPSIAFEDDAVIIAGTRYPKRGYGSGHGNWCWDAVNMTVGDTKALLRHLKKLYWWFDTDDASEFTELEDVVTELEATSG